MVVTEDEAVHEAEEEDLAIEAVGAVLEVRSKDERHAGRNI